MDTNTHVQVEGCSSRACRLCDLSAEHPEVVTNAPKVLFQRLNILDRLLTPLILVFMVVGVLIGEFVPGVQPAFDTVRFDSVSVPIAIGLIVMMWPILTKVRYEALGHILFSKKLWIHMGISFILNWIVGPLVMLGLAWATLPDLPTYRAGVILVGIARCIAVVMVWNQLAGGDMEYCALLVVANSILQIVLYSPYAVLFINVVGSSQSLHLQYSSVAISVLIYLGIPLVAGVITRFSVMYFMSKRFLQDIFLPRFAPLALVGLLYTVVVIFAYQGHHIVHNLGPVFRVFVPMILYFVVMWTSAFGFVYYLARKEARRGKTTNKIFAYDVAVVQAFTAGSNNFELAIAVAIAVYGVGSDQALAATIGPLVEVPVLLSLTWVAQFLRTRLDWGGDHDSHHDQAMSVDREKGDVPETKTE
ncbi:sodium bile acid symporter family-domain-containing protein [Boletus edulis BED1]|uniref:Sodium bile acid symporter family-domain-containing protein n=1 Tax=Boletus edulis BED1 TaxID=1328754 RepID=A0AAD4C544_BOLED|nr:sodium bile acid symporter family-domain-containing protein [Boletus edulis BED1]